MPLDHYTPRVGIMRDVKFGLQEYVIALTLRLDTGRGWMTDLTLFHSDYQRLLRETRVDDVNRLNGKACYYIITDGIVRFKGPVLDSPESRAWDWEENKEKDMEEFNWMLRLHWIRQGKSPVMSEDEGRVRLLWLELGRHMGVPPEEA